MNTCDHLKWLNCALVWKLKFMSACSPVVYSWVLKAKLKLTNCCVLSICCAGMQLELVWVEEVYERSMNAVDDWNLYSLLWFCEHRETALYHLILPSLLCGKKIQLLIIKSSIHHDCSVNIEKLSSVIVCCNYCPVGRGLSSWSLKPVLITAVLWT